jgi:hypothetical protein
VLGANLVDSAAQAYRYYFTIDIFVWQLWAVTGCSPMGFGDPVGNMCRSAPGSVWSIETPMEVF